jgi:small-conductance mechanosensitive channel
MDNNNLVIIIVVVIVLLVALAFLGVIPGLQAGFAALDPGGGRGVA